VVSLPGHKVVYAAYAIFTPAQGGAPPVLAPGCFAPPLRARDVILFVEEHDAEHGVPQRHQRRPSETKSVRTCRAGAAPGPSPTCRQVRTLGELTEHSLVPALTAFVGVCSELPKISVKDSQPA
jgi:hypothetical protein